VNYRQIDRPPIRTQDDQFAAQSGLPYFFSGFDRPIRGDEHAEYGQPTINIQVDRIFGLAGFKLTGGALPTIGLGLFGGALADRVQKKQILVTCFLLVAVIAALIGVALDSGRLKPRAAGSWWMLWQPTSSRDA